MSWSLALWLGLAGAVDCADVLDRTETCASPVAVAPTPDSFRSIPKSNVFEAEILAPRLFAASGIAAFVALGAGTTAVFYQKHLSDLAATGNLSRAAEDEMRFYTSSASIASVGAGIGALLLLGAGVVFVVFDPSDGGLREGIAPLQE